MYIAKVIGTVVASRKSPAVEGLKLLIVQPLDHRGRPNGSGHVAVDTVMAGPGDLVHCVASREAALALETEFAPVDAAIVGIVDSVDTTSGSFSGESKGEVR